jgi:predicted DNA-binding protein (UPF0251 family)
MTDDQGGSELVPKKRAEVLKPKEGERPIDQDILDIEAARLRNEERLGYREIAQRMGCSVSTAHTRVQRVYQDAKIEATEMMRHLERERLDTLWQHAKKIAETTYYVTAHGKVVLDPETGQPLVDPMPNLQARKEMRAIAESMRKLEGLDQPTKVEQSGAIEYKISGADPSDLV